MQGSTRSVEFERFPLGLQVELMRQLSKSEGNDSIHISGTNSLLALALIVCETAIDEKNEQPQVIVLPSEELMSQFIECVKYFNPSLNTYTLPKFDTTPYSGLYPSPRKVSQRVSWIYHAQNCQSKDIFVSHTEALLQKTIRFSDLKQNTLRFGLDESLDSSFSLKLSEIGYQSTPLVEDVGTFSNRGGTFDLFSPCYRHPIRFELFGDTIESIRFFDPETQRSIGEAKFVDIVPPKEILFSDDIAQALTAKIREGCEDRSVDSEELRQTLQSVIQKNYFHGCDYLLPYFYEQCDSPLDHFSTNFSLWLLDPLELSKAYDEFLASLKAQYVDSTEQVIHISPERYYGSFDELFQFEDSKKIILEPLEIKTTTDEIENQDLGLHLKSATLTEFSLQCDQRKKNLDDLTEYIDEKLGAWLQQNYKILVSTHTKNQASRLELLLKRCGLEPEIISESNYCWASLLKKSQDNRNFIAIIPRPTNDSLRLIDERLIFLRDEDFFGRKRHLKPRSTTISDKKAHALSFGDLNPGDLIIHKQHGMGIYRGLKTMPIQGIETEFIELEYKGKDKLFLPVYRVGQIQRYAGSGSAASIDKLGGNQWNKVKTKAKKQIRDIAGELLKLYAKRAQTHRPPFSQPDDDFISFESSFSFDETDDQLKAINEVLLDMTKDSPMDRLICGDVGFGKTEVAMRAAFKAVQDSKQVCIIAPTTILSFQHTENFRKRFKDWPVQVRALNRFVSKKEIKDTLIGLKTGQVDIVIGTHRLLSKDVEFKNLGLLIIDEEQKFGVKHKEKIRQMKVSVDTIAMSATPIPRTLNLSLVGLRDLSLITTPPVDRLPTRTFVCKYDKETIRKGIESEIKRGGQVFFLHNRVGSIYAVASELRELVPNARIAVGHGQMEEHELEKTMLKFFNHEVDLLLCTTIIESGIDNPNANTMFINDAQNLGVSQLYQLRGRVGRSKERAYCYLLVPPRKKLDQTAIERLKVIQENTALGSGITIAQHDLELRGSGDILGQEQSGHVNAIGYEMYLELLEDAIAELKGEPKKSDIIEPEINIRIPALIPDKYIPDIRIRLSYYKALAEIDSPADLDRIEEELADQFGQPPEPVLNLMGLMLIRKYCRDLGIKDISSSTSMITLSFTQDTPLPSEKVVELSMRENKKFSITPDHKLKIRMKNISWPNIYDELMLLLRLCPKGSH